MLSISCGIRSIRTFLKRSPVPTMNESEKGKGYNASSRFHTTTQSAGGIPPCRSSLAAMRESTNWYLDVVHHCKGLGDLLRNRFGSHFRR